MKRREKSRETKHWASTHSPSLCCLLSAAASTSRDGSTTHRGAHCGRTEEKACRGVIRIGRATQRALLVSSDLITPAAAALAEI